MTETSTPAGVGAATFTHENDEHAGHLYYIKIAGRTSGPYTNQRHVDAIIDIADDGTLAGVELIDNMPPPPAIESLTAPPDGVTLDADAWAELHRYRAEKGPDEFETWKDAAVAEKVARVAADAALSAERAAREAERAWKPTHRHIRRGSEYQLIGVGTMQSAYWLTTGVERFGGYDPGESVDDRKVAVYRAEDGTLWVRPLEEFEDGRFELLPAALSQEQKP